MSHTDTIRNLQIRRLDLLGRAAERCGLTLVEGQTAIRGYYKEQAKVDHAVVDRGNPGSYELGVKRNEEGAFDLLLDTFAGGGGLVEKVGGPRCERLRQFYALESALEQGRELEDQGWVSHWAFDEQGNLLLEYESAL